MTYGKSIPNPRQWLLQTAVVALVSGLPVASNAGQGALPSQEIARFETLHWVITPSLFQEMCEIAALPERERAVAADAYGLYWPQAVSLDRTATEAVREAGADEVRRLYENLIAAKLDRPPDAVGPSDEQLRLESAISQLQHNVRVAAWRFERQANDLVRRLLQTCVDTNAFSEDVRFRLERFLRRRLILPSASSGNGDFLLTVDLLALIDEERAPGRSPRDLFRDASIRPALDDILMQYELSLDAFLRAHPLAFQSRPIPVKTVYRSTDAEFGERRERAAEQASDLWSIQRQGIDDLFIVANAVDSRAAKNWRRVAQAKMNPVVYRHVRTRELFEWCADRLGLTSAQYAQLHELDSRFHDRHDDLCHEAFRAGVAAECDAAARFGGRATSRLNLRYAEDQLAIHKNGRDFVRSALAILNATQREEAVRWLTPATGASLWLGPVMHPTTVAALGCEREYDDIRKGVFLE